MTPPFKLQPPSGATGMSEGKSLSIPWQEMLETVFRRRWTILAVAILGLLSATVLAWLKPPVFKAQAKVMLTAQPGTGTREGAMPDKQIKAELAMLKSEAFIKSVLDTYREEETNVVPEVVDEIDPEAIAKRIEAGPIDQSNMVQLTFTDADPRWAAQFINDLLAHHIDRVAQLNEQLNTRSFFEQQKDLAARRWLEARQALTEFRERQGANLLSGDVNQLRSVIADLEARRVDSETDVLQLQAKVHFLSSEIGRLPETVAAETRIPENESTTSLRSRISELEIERLDLLSRYTPTSTVVRDIDRRIEQAKKLLAEQGSSETISETTTEVNPSFQTLEIDLLSARAQLTEAEARVEALSAQLARYRSRLGGLERAAAELERLQNEVESARLADENYRQRGEEARLSAALDESKIGNLIIVERAGIPPKPESSNRRLIVVFGLLAGLLLGTGLAFLSDWLNPSVKSSIQAERLIGVPVIAEIPAR